MKTSGAHLSILCIALLCAFAPAEAVPGGTGVIEVGTYDEDPVDEPVGDCSGENNSGANCAGSTADAGMGDPETAICPAEDLDGVGGDDGLPVDMQSVVECIDDRIGGVYVVEPLYEGNSIVGVTISRSDGVPLTALCFRETLQGIQSVRVTLDRPDRVGRIAKFPRGMEFTGGFVDLELNGRLFTFDTKLALYQSSVLNAQIRDTLRHHGFRLEDTGNYWVVARDPTGAGIETIRFASNDSAIVKSEVSIEPPNAFDFSYCFPPGGWPEPQPSVEHDDSGPLQVVERSSGR